MTELASQIHRAVPTHLRRVLEASLTPLSSPSMQADGKFWAHHSTPTMPSAASASSTAPPDDPSSSSSFTNDLVHPSSKDVDGLLASSPSKTRDGSHLDSAVPQGLPQTFPRGIAPLNAATSSAAPPTPAAEPSFDPSTISAELRELYSSFQSCLDLRDKYMRLSRQRLEDDPRSYDGEFWCDDVDPSSSSATPPSQGADGSNDHIRRAEAPFPPWKIYPEPPRPHWEPAPSSAHSLPDSAWKVSEGEDKPQKKNEFVFGECELPGRVETGSGRGWDFEMDERGVYQVYDPTASSSTSTPPSTTTTGTTSPPSTSSYRKPLFQIPTIKEYFLDLDHVLSVISDGPAKSFAWRRLRYLESKWSMYSLLNEYQELADMKRVPHRCVWLAPLRLSALGPLSIDGLR